ncbi:MAG: DUF3592 domain-containing protein [Thermoanaerobaculia bacterium]
MKIRAPVSVWEWWGSASAATWYLTRRLWSTLSVYAANRTGTGLGFLAFLLFGSAWLTASLALSERERSSWSSTLGSFDGIREETKEAQPGRDMVRRTYTVDWSGYAYVVNGTKYRNEVHRLLDPTAALTVYFDPADPRRSTVDKPSSPIPPLILTILCLIGGGVAVKTAWKLRQDADTPKRSGDHSAVSKSL